MASISVCIYMFGFGGLVDVFVVCVCEYDNEFGIWQGPGSICICTEGGPPQLHISLNL
jgi:hypothetical protein